MEIRHISPNYAVAPQIEPSDMAALAAQGFGTVICNRPDSENPPNLRVPAMQAAAEAAGLTFVVNPVTHQGLNMDMAHLQRQSIDASDKPVLAYCASGTRSAIVWALGQAEEQSPEDIISAAAKAGYELGGMRPQLEMLSGK